MSLSFKALSQFWVTIATWLFDFPAFNRVTIDLTITRGCWSDSYSISKEMSDFLEKQNNSSVKEFSLCFAVITHFPSSCKTILFSLGDTVSLTGRHCPCGCFYIRYLMLFFCSGSHSDLWICVSLLCCCLVDGKNKYMLV